MTPQCYLEAAEADRGHVILARPFLVLSRVHAKNISFLQDLMLSSLIDKNCLRVEDFGDLQAERQTLWMLECKQILFDFT